MGLSKADITKILWDCRGELSAVGIADLIGKALAIFPPGDVASKFLDTVDWCGKYQEYLAVKYMQLREMEKDPFDAQEIKPKPITSFFEKFQKVTQAQVIAETTTCTHGLVYPLIPYNLGYSRASLQRVVHNMRTHQDNRLILFKTLQEELCHYGVVDGTSKIREAYRSCGYIGEFQAAITQIGTLLGCKTLKEVKWLQAILNDDVILYEEYLREEQQHQKHVSDQQAAAADMATEEEIVESSCKRMRKNLKKKKKKKKVVSSNAMLNGTERKKILHQSSFRWMK